MLKELEQIQVMLDNNQVSACLSFIEQLEQTHTDCACLVAAKIPILRALNRWEEAEAVATAFYEREPENRLAGSELAIVKTLTGRSKEAISLLIDIAEKEEGDSFHSAILTGLYLTGMRFLAEGDVLMGVAIAKQLKAFPSMDKAANELLMRSLSIPNVPVILRELTLDPTCPTDFPGKADFDEAVRLATRCHWKSGLEKFESLIPQAAQCPQVWWNIALIRLWLCMDDEAVDALEAYAASPALSDEDVAEAESLRNVFLQDALGDEVDIISESWEISDVEKVRESLLSNARVQVLETDLSRFGDADNPPPKQAYLVLDNPFLADAEAYNIENSPSQIATLFLYGKQTDREARLEVVEVNANDREMLEGIIRETLGENLGVLSEPNTIGNVPQTQWLLQPRFRFKRDAIPSEAKSDELNKDFYEKKFVDAWLNLPLNVFEGKTPQEASNDPKFRSKLLGAIYSIDFWIDPEFALQVGNIIRDRLSLPTLGQIFLPVVPDDVLKQSPLVQLELVPVWRWYRLEPEKLSTPILIHITQIFDLMGERRAGTKFDRALINRPREEMTFNHRALAYQHLIREAQAKMKFREALDWIGKAKVDATIYEVSNGALDIIEIGVRIQMMDTDGAQKLISEVMVDHRNEPDVMNALQQLFVQLGLLNPDGTPTQAGMGANHPMDPNFDPNQVLREPQQESGGGASKLWVPD